MIYYLKKEWRWNALVILANMFDAALSVASNVLLIALFQNVIDGDVGQFARTVAGFFGVCVLDNLVCILSGWASSRAIMAMNNRYRADAVATILSSSHSRLHARDSGEYLSWLTNDVSQISGMAWEPFYNAVLRGAQMLFSAAVLASMHWSLLLASGVVALVVIHVPKLAQKRLEALSVACSQQQAKATAKLKDLLLGVDVLLSFGRRERFAGENREASRELEQPKQRLKCTQTVVNEGVNFVSTLCTLLVLLLIGILSIRGVLSKAALTGGANMVSTISGGLAIMSQYWLSIKACKPYFDKITLHEEETGEKKAEQGWPVENKITMENLSFAYDQKQVLKNAHFTFQKGGKYALIGPSGCGKSTVLKLLLGWLPEYQGTIRFDDAEAREVDQEQRLEQMSYIAQDVFLFNTTIRDNITLGGVFTAQQMERAIRCSALDGDLAHMPLGLDTPVGEDGSALSGGQKQRVAIARALIHERSILLVDEGTSALDQENADIVEESLLENPELTLILVSHHLTEDRKRRFTQVYDLTPAAG